MKWLMILLVSAGLFMAGSWVYRFTNKPTPPPLPKVATTIYPLYDLVRQIAGSGVEVTLLIPPGTDPTMATSSALPTFAIGSGLDQADPAIPVSSSITLIPDNPYYYLSLNNVLIIVNNIEKELSEHFPTKSDEFQQNAKSLSEKIDALNQQATVWASASAEKTLTAPREWAYVAADYNLTFKEGSSSAFLDPFGGSITTDTYLNLMEYNLKTLLNAR